MNKTFQTEDQVAELTRAIRTGRGASIERAFSSEEEEVDMMAMDAIRAIRAIRASRRVRLDHGIDYVPTTVLEARAARELEDAMNEAAAADAIRLIRIAKGIARAHQ